MWLLGLLLSLSLMLCGQLTNMVIAGNMAREEFTADQEYLFIHSIYNAVTYINTLGDPCISASGDNHLVSDDCIQKGLNNLGVFSVDQSDSTLTMRWPVKPGQLGGVVYYAGHTYLFVSLACRDALLRAYGLLSPSFYGPYGFSQGSRLLTPSGEIIQGDKSGCQINTDGQDMCTSIPQDIPAGSLVIIQ